MRVFVQRELQLSHTRTDPLQDEVRELRAGNKVCLVSYMPVKSSWLKAIILHFCSPFPDYCWFCDFVLFGALIILSFFKASYQCINRIQIQKKVGPLCPLSLPTPLFQVHSLEIWIEISPGRRSGLCLLVLSCSGKNHTIHAVPEIQWSDSCFLS